MNLHLPPPLPVPLPLTIGLFKSLIFFYMNISHHTTIAPPTIPINSQTHISTASTNEAAIEGLLVEEGVAAAAPAVLLLLLGLEEVEDPTGPPVPLALTVPVQVLTETPVLFLHGPGVADERKVMSAQLYNPPAGSPLVTTWIVAVCPSLTLRDEGIG